MPARFERALAHGSVVPLAVAVLVAAQHAYLLLLLRATFRQQPLLPLLGRTPVRFIDSLAPNHLPALFGDGFAALVLLESLALVALYCGLAPGGRARYGVVAAGCVLACADGVLSRAATSADMYSYVGFTLLGPHAYAPPAAAFAGAYSVINAWWHTPLVAAPYGPLWLGTASVVVAGAHTLFAKIVALRLLGAVTLAGTAAVLLALNIPPRIVALVALNPALTFEFVANVHNDLFGVLLLLIARYATGRGRTWLGVAFAAAAGLVKVPFVLFAALAFVPLPSFLSRARAYTLAAALALGASWFAGGAAYVAAIRRHAADSTAGHIPAALAAAGALLKAVAFAGLALAFTRGVWIEGCAWALPALGAIMHPWYLCWALPYAVASGRSLRNVAIALPVVMLVCDGALADGTLLAVLTLGSYLWLAAALARALAARLRDTRARRRAAA